MAGLVVLDGRTPRRALGEIVEAPDDLADGRSIGRMPAAVGPFEDAMPVDNGISAQLVYVLPGQVKTATSPDERA